MVLVLGSNQHELLENINKHAPVHGEFQGQVNELLCKIIAYNITVLIHEMIQLNGTTELLSFNGLQKEIVGKPLEYIIN